MANTTTRKPVTTRKATPPVPVRTKPSKKIHPAEQAGMAVHQAVESGVSTVKDTVATAGSYVFGFVKGLIKGH